MSDPFLSIVVPTYDRASLVARALESCFRQDYRDYEVIVVDDGSRDDTLRVVRAIGNPRLRIVVHEANRGVGPARNSGVEVARGEWIVCLDSDDELLDGALTAIADRARALPAGVDGMRFMVRLDSGETSPDPPLSGEIWDYEQYVKWMERCFGRRQETLPVVRRSTFGTVRYPDDRSLETLYHFDFARAFRIQACPDVVRLYHRDSADQLTRPSAARSIAMAADQSRQFEAVLARHGAALRQWAPTVFRTLTSGLLTTTFLAGRRRDGVRRAGDCLRREPLSVRHWSVLVAGLIGPRPLAAFQAVRSRLARGRERAT